MWKKFSKIDLEESDEFFYRDPTLWVELLRDD